jgi:valyl-tRNA synthetase
VLSQVRKAKSEAKVSMRADIDTAVVSGPTAAVQRVLLAAGDLRGAGRIASLTAVEGSDALAVEVTLAEVSP